MSLPKHALNRVTMRRLLIVLLIFLSAVLLFWRLDGAFLWRDEATTANWARIMVTRGQWLPWVTDGDQLVVQALDGHDFNSQLLPAMQSWLQFYVTAASFKVLGIGTVTARLPFALLGALCLWVLYRIGVVLFGTGLRSFLLPYLAILSIFFLFAARQSRYYILAVLAVLLLMLEFFRYLRSPVLAAQRTFYLRLGFYGLLLYFSNYVSFAATWAALGVFVLLHQDRQLVKGFFALSTGLGIILGVEFWLFHSEFAASWPPPEPKPLVEVYASALIRRGHQLWQVLPIFLLVPAGVYLLWKHVPRLPAVVKAGSLLAVALVFVPMLLHQQPESLREPGLGFAYGLACLTVPGTFLLGWIRLPQPGVWPRAALLAGLILGLSPLITIAAGKQSANTRHYMQVLPAALVLGALATAGLRQQRRGALAPVFFAGLVLWPNLCFNFFGNEQIVERQLFRDQSYNEPLVHFLRERVSPGDRVAFYRNVKGMMAYFYLSEIRWVGLLDSSAPHNQKLRHLLADDQFDDYSGADWYVIWDPGSGWPKHLTEDRYERVWEYTYAHRQNWWERGEPPATRTYQVFQRRH